MPHYFEKAFQGAMSLRKKLSTRSWRKSFRGANESTESSCAIKSSPIIRVSPPTGFSPYLEHGYTSFKGFRFYHTVSHDLRKSIREAPSTVRACSSRTGSLGLRFFHNVNSHPWGNTFASIARTGTCQTSSLSKLMLSLFHSKAFQRVLSSHIEPQLQHFRRRGFGRGSGRKLTTRQYVLIIVGTTGLCMAIYFSHIEVVPYTYRKHFVLLSPELETKMVESQFEALKQQWGPLVLPPLHPLSIRVRGIARDVIKAVLEGTQLQDSHTMQLEHGGKVHTRKEGDVDVLVWQDNTNFPASSQLASKEEVLDDRWIDKSRKKGLKKGSKPFVEHLKKEKWEVLVVDKDIVNAFCLPGGKIVVFTGLLKRFPSDEEIATVLGHEVSHVVARHAAERMTRHLYVTLLQLFLLAFIYSPDLVQTMSILFLELPFSRKQELEADHIGLLLMASAGYDPRVAPSVYEKLGELGGTVSELLQYVTTHPSGKKRGERLRRTGTMEDALRIYRERTQGRVVEGFLRTL